MKKHIILPITLAAMMMLGGCNNSTTTTTPTTPSTEPTSTEPGPSSVVAESVTIINKTDLQAEWHVGDATRRVNIVASPEIENINECLDNGSLTITSSNAEIVSVTRLLLTPKATGKATITVNYGGKSDSVEITVSVKLTAIDKYGTVHKGTAEDPFDNADAVKAAPLAKAASDTTKYYIKGIVRSFYHIPGERTDGVVSWFIKDAEGNKGFECYKIKHEDGSSLTDDDVWVGAEVIVKGVLTVYSGQVETDTGIFVENTGNGAAKPEARKTITATVAEAVAAGKALEDGDSAWDYYKVTGYVASVADTNVWIADEKGSTAANKDLLQLYLEYFSGKVFDPENKETTVAAGITKGAKVEVTLIIKNYHEQVENAIIKGDIKILEAGEVEAAPTPISVADAITLINGLEDGATTKEKYVIEAYVTKVTYTWKDGTISFLVGASADATDVITVFKAACLEAVGKTIVAGAKVKVAGYLKKFVKDDIVTPELAGGTVELLEAAPGSGNEGGGSTTTNYGTLEAPLTVTEALALASSECSSPDSWTAQQVYVKGIVKNQPDYSGSYITTFYLKDDASEVMVYSCNKASGVADPDQNDEVAIHGYIKNYKGTIEFATKDKTYYVELDSNNRGTSTISVASASSSDATVSLSASSGVNGSNFTFTVSVAEGKEVESVSVNGKTVEATEGTYTGTVHGNTTVLVETKEAGAVSAIVDSNYDFTKGMLDSAWVGDNDIKTYTGSTATVQVNRNGGRTNFAESSGHSRWYKNSIVTIAPVGEISIKKIELNFAYATDKNSAEKYSTAVYTSGSTASIVDKVVTIIPGADGKVVVQLGEQARVTGMSVYYIAA